MPNIAITNIGPVTEFEYSLGGFGLHVLRGKQGAGKSTVLRSIELAVNGRTETRLQKRDGAARGEASIAGHTIRISKQIREEGELQVIEGLGGMSIADLHAPRFDKPETRDRHRIKTLVSLAGVTADATLFRPLLPDGWFESIVNEDSLRTDDLVDMTARVKRGIEADAQRVEKREETAMANARAQTAIAEGIDLEQDHDELALQDSLERAIQAHATAKAKSGAIDKRATYAADTTTRAADARARLESIGGGVTVSEAEAKRLAASDAVAAVQQQIDRLEQKLAEAKRTRVQMIDAQSAALAALQSAQREAALHSELMAAIDAAKDLTAPSIEERAAATALLQRAAEAVDDAKAAITTGTKVRSAIAAKELAADHMEKAKRLGIEARYLRDAAKDTAIVLSNAIATINGCPLKVKLTEDGESRLVISTERSDEEYFDELSDGLRWLHIVKLAASANRLIVLHQSAFGELAPSSREYLDQLAKEHQCWIVTAEAADCELHGAPYLAARGAAEHV